MTPADEELGKRMDFEFTATHSKHTAVLTLQFLHPLSECVLHTERLRATLRVRQPVRWIGQTEVEEVVINREYLHFSHIPLFLCRIGRTIEQLLYDPFDTVHREPVDRPVDRILFSLCDQLAPITSRLREIQSEYTRPHPRKD